MTTHHGFDISGYPGDSAMEAFWNNTPFSWTGFYLAPAPHHSDTSWMSKRSFLKNLGYGFAIIYVGRQSGDGSLLTYSQGQTDAANANSLAQQAGFTTVNTVIYLDVETGGTLGSAQINYINGWMDYIAQHTIYMPGIYCSHAQTADQIRAANSNGVNNCEYWVWNISGSSPGCTTSTGSLTVADSGVSYANAWQYAQSPSSTSYCAQTWNGYTLHVDLSMSTTSNPSNG